MREKSGIDAALCVSLAVVPAAEDVCPAAGIAAAVATATTRRKSRCIYIGHLPFMSIARPDPAAHFLFWHSPDEPQTDSDDRRFLVRKHDQRLQYFCCAQVRFWRCVTSNAGPHGAA